MQNARCAAEPFRGKSPNQKRNSARVPRVFPSTMKTKLILAAALVGGVLSTSAFGYAKESAATEVAQLAAPVVAKIVHPTGLSRRNDGATVRVALSLDEHGKPSDIRVLSNNDRNLRESLVPAVAQWEFIPARVNGKAVPSRVELPIKLVAADNS